jgi:ornithine cyclodeaminase
MARVISLEEIKRTAAELDLSAAIEEGFVAYSKGVVVVPPVGEMIFEDPPGDTHIKYGYIKGDDYFVIKIASGFYENFKLDLPSGSGLMLLFSQKTGRLESVLLDEGYLTDMRTAVAGQVAARYLAPKNIRRIGVFGTGIQARMQVEYLRPVTGCRDITVWGRSEEPLQAYKQDMESRGYMVQTTREAGEVMEDCNLIITATPAGAPLMEAVQVRPGTHITAMGSDTPEKQELDPAILKRADLVVADSIRQCRERGEIFQALKSGLIREEDVLELGRIIADPGLGRTSEEQITVVDLTGVAVQDLQIAKAVYLALSQPS